MDFKINIKEARLDRVKNLILELNPGKMLDVGCCNCDFSKQFSQFGWQIYGIDLNLQPVKENIIIKKVNLDTENIPFDDNFFDLVFAGEVIEHLVDTDHFLSEVNRVLIIGGTFIITTPNLASLENRIRILFGKYPKWLEYDLNGIGHIRAYTPKVLKKQLIKYGFKIEKHFGNFLPIIPQRFIDDLKFPILKYTGNIYPNFSQAIIIKSIKQEDYKKEPKKCLL